MLLRDLIPILQSAIGPVILVSGVALLLLTMTNRLGRLIDRSRQLSQDLRMASGADHGKIVAQLHILLARARMLRGAITLAALSVLGAALLIIAIFLGALLGLQSGLHLVLLFVACMACLIASLVLFLRDINLSLSALRLEVGTLPPGPRD